MGLVDQSSSSELVLLGSSWGLAHNQCTSLEKELQTDTVPLLAVKKVTPTNSQQCGNGENLVGKRNLTAHNTAARNKLIAQHADSAFG
jgi:hypothetical protein